MLQLSVRQMCLEKSKSRFREIKDTRHVACIFFKRSSPRHNMFIFKGLSLQFFVLSVSVLYRLLCMLKVFKFKRVKVRTKRSSSLPQKTLLLKRLRSSPAFNSVTFRHHATSPCLTYSTYTYSSASLAHKNVFSMAALLSLALLSQVCASWPISADWVFRRRGLKETGAKTETEGNTELQHWTEQLGTWKQYI